MEPMTVFKIWAYEHMASLFMHTHLFTGGKYQNLSKRLYARALYFLYCDLDSCVNKCTV